LSLENEGEIKNFSDNLNLKQVITSRSELQEGEKKSFVQ
jgi:hypothetical protein